LCSEGGFCGSVPPPCLRNHPATLSDSVGAGVSPDAAVDVPPDCLRLVMVHCMRILHAVNNPTDSDQLLPEFVDSITDWKELCSVTKSAIKFILSEAASAAPEDALLVMLQVLQESIPLVQAVQKGAPEDTVSTAANRIDVCSLAVAVAGCPALPLFVSNKAAQVCQTGPASLCRTKETDLPCHISPSSAKATRICTRAQARNLLFTPKRRNVILAGALALASITVTD
jgi:hypothetical protein